MQEVGINEDKLMEIIDVGLRSKKHRRIYE